MKKHQVHQHEGPRTESPCLILVTQHRRTVDKMHKSLDAVRPHQMALHSILVLFIGRSSTVIPTKSSSPIAQHSTIRNAHLPKPSNSQQKGPMHTTSKFPAKKTFSKPFRTPTYFRCGFGLCLAHSVACSRQKQDLPTSKQSSDLIFRKLLQLCCDLNLTNKAGGRHTRVSPIAERAGPGW